MKCKTIALGWFTILFKVKFLWNSKGIQLNTVLPEQGRYMEYTWMWRGTEPKHNFASEYIHLDLLLSETTTVRKIWVRWWWPFEHRVLGHPENYSQINIDMKAKRQLTSLYITAHIDESIACVVSPSYSQHSCARSTMYYMHWISLLQPVSTAYTATITNEYMSAHIFIVYLYIYYITLWAYINENLVIWNEWCVAHRPCLINNLNKLCIYFGWMSHNKHTQHKLRV